MQARVILGVLAIGLTGGAAGLARCPQLVSFSPATSSPLPQEARALPASDFQNVVFRPAGAPHQTLLKASMPSLGTGLKCQRQASPQSSRHVLRPALQRVRKIRSQTRQWVVLTSFIESGSIESGRGPGNETPESARIVLTVARGQTFSPSYAVVPTAGGWLVFQL
jgi:hypothetical protein